jgi:hypothetical protein
VAIDAIEADRKGIVVRLKVVDKAFAGQKYAWSTTTRPRGLAPVVSR